MASKNNNPDNAAATASLLEDFVDFLNEAWTAYHATAEARRRLLAAGFEELDESQATHDVKPVSKASKAGFLQLATQPYGGGLWHTWFDRDLGVAGRAIVKRGEGKYSHDLVKINRPVLRIPTLAIHLTKADERKSFSPNLQSNFFPVLATEVKAKLTAGGASSKAAAGEGESPGKEGGGDERHHALLVEMVAEELGCQPEDVKDFELQFWDTQPSCLGGACSEFVFSGRLDNFCSSWQSIRALIDGCEGDGLASCKGVRSVFLFDHEEVGSTSCHGAAGTLLPDCMKRIAKGLAASPSDFVMEAVVRKSFLVSADMAHALHPNYQDRHDPALGPKIHSGMVLKHNANQRYATNAVTAFFFRELGARAGLPTQEFAVKSDSACGSTIGPTLSALSGIRTVDVGSPQLSMHSIREMMGADDAVFGYRHIKGVFVGCFSCFFFASGAREEGCCLGRL
ncbi:conserved unknown protein [Ectocarpus siliculosus]|uniref:Aspartyl aminopeptidase n=1 Tax=Ectocarpus siliculosus TaxID=2880 RepID=D8LK99_ECTSI|nr:conserved unknown protein [Ectocarpus siliculosus]|eukprot:CBN79633.1 conserved unknown protein [Ectocarpus siliculosus]